MAMGKETVDSGTTRAVILSNIPLSSNMRASYGVREESAMIEYAISGS
jgi:hypothetical protein